MSKRKHLSKYARLRAQLEYVQSECDYEVKMEWRKAREHFELRTAVIVAENARLMRLICDFTSLVPTPVIFLDA